jgi:hypothetical protein
MPPPTFRELVHRFTDLIALAIPLLVGLALLIFLLGLARFLFHFGNEEARRAGKDMMLYGTVGLFVMVAVWGLVNILTVTVLGEGVL